MAYEKLFIGSDVRGIKEIVPQGTGFLFSSENKDDLKKVVKKVASLSPQDKNRYKKGALAFVVSQKSWLQNAKKYKEIYTSLSL
jgi:glycosyltransferase involved in cell wall biosynthesis